MMAVTAQLKADGQDVKMIRVEGPWILIAGGLWLWRPRECGSPSAFMFWFGGCHRIDSSTLLTTNCRPVYTL
eukprot:scaffold88532_cov39-Phaeocystis_antarctica.AAC.1